MSNVEQLLTELRKQGVKVWAEDGLVRVNAPKGTLTPALRSELATRKVELLAALGQTNGHSHPLHEPIRPVSRDQTLPLSFNQQRLWVMERLNSGSAYNQFGALCCEGELSIRALTQSLTEIVRRHEILRTVFPEQNGGPVQLIQLPNPSSCRSSTLHSLLSLRVRSKPGNWRLQKPNSPSTWPWVLFCASSYCVWHPNHTSCF